MVVIGARLCKYGYTGSLYFELSRHGDGSKGFTVARFYCVMVSPVYCEFKLVRVECNVY